MYENMTSINLFGLNEILSTSRVPSSQSLGTKDKTTNQVFADLLDKYSNYEEQDGVEQFMKKAGITMPTGDSLKQLYMNSILQTITSGYYETKTDETNSSGQFLQAAEETATTASTGSSSTATTTTVASTTTNSPTRSQEEVVMTVGSQNTVLMDKINNSTTMDDRLKYETEMRDKIISALRDEGYTVETTSSLDEISINGQVVDVLQNSGTPGMVGRVIFLGEAQAGAPTANDDVVSAILTAAQTGIDMLMQIRSSQDIDEQRQLAQSIRTMLVDNLNAMGYNTSAVFGSADKITVNGNTYDFIRGLGSDGNQTQFQAMLV